MPRKASERPRSHNVWDSGDIPKDVADLDTYGLESSAYFDSNDSYGTIKRRRTKKPAGSVAKG